MSIIRLLFCFLELVQLSGPTKYPGTLGYIHDGHTIGKRNSQYLMVIYKPIKYLCISLPISALRCTSSRLFHTSNSPERGAQLI